MIAREQSRADKSSAGSDHTSVHKHHPVCYLNPTSAARLDAMMKKKRRGVVKSVSVLPAKSKSNLHKVSPILPAQKAYSSTSKRKKELFAMLEKIPGSEGNPRLESCNPIKKKESKFVPDPLPSSPVKPSMFFNPFKFKKDVTMS